jgi:hypothetical protein
MFGTHSITAMRSLYHSFSWLIIAAHLMSDPLRTAHANAAPLSDADREARIEALLLSGLDHYFSGQYEQAINIWTRVAFLERRHGRARAYIERARSALAEQQRESEELLHAGIAAYDGGDLTAARDLLTRAVEHGDASDTALVFLQRLRRSETASDALRGDSGAATASARPLPRRGAEKNLAENNWALTIAVSAAVAAAILLATRPVTSWLAELPLGVPIVDAAPPEPVPIVRPSALAIDRARALRADGHLRDALRTLDRVPIADPLRPEADRIRADVQRDLLAMIPGRAAR